MRSILALLQSYCHAWTLISLAVAALLLAAAGCGSSGGESGGASGGGPQQVEVGTIRSGWPDTRRIATALERAHHLAQAGCGTRGALRDDEELPGPQRLAGLAHEFERDSGIGCHMEVTGQRRELGSQARLAVYRTAQEALTNVRKHAHAQRVELRLGYERDGTRLTVEDYAPDGVRAAAGDGDGYGLTGMRERAELLDGTLEAAPTGTGFRVELWVPG
jgi:signal transduction histidine kinase